MNPYQYKEYIRFTNQRHSDLVNPQKVWSKNTEINLPRIKKKWGIWNQDGKYTNENEKAIIVIGASPCLKDDVHKLKDLDKRYFRTVAVNSSLKFLLKHDVVPDYVVAVDGDPGNLVGHLDVGEISSRLITSNAVAPEIFDVWKGEEVWWTPYYGIHKELKSKVRYRLGRTIPAGGSAFTIGVSVAVGVWEARTIIFVANEHCYDKEYYVDGQYTKWDESDLTTFKCTDVLGRRRITNLPLHQYNSWLEYQCDNKEDTNFICTSFGIAGTGTDRIHNIELTEAIEMVEMSFFSKEVNEKRVAVEREYNTDRWQEREKERYDKAYATGEYVPFNGRQFYKNFFNAFYLDGVKSHLDVGCGLGCGVKLMRDLGIESYGVDISSEIKPFWKTTGIANYCKVASADNMPFPDNRFDFIVCVDMLEHAPCGAIEDILREILRVGNSTFIFNICTMPAGAKMPHDGSEPHICVRPQEWWIEQIYECGFKAITLIPIIQGTNISVLLLAMKGDEDGSELSSDDMLVQPRKDVRFAENKSKVPGSD